MEYNIRSRPRGKIKRSNIKKMENFTTTITKPNNKGVLRGVILEKAEKQYQIEDEFFYEGKIVVGRLSETNDILPFTISEKLVQAYNISLDAGKRVEMSGELRSYNKMLDGKSRLILSFFVKEIKEQNQEEDENDLSLTGYICKEPVFRTTPFNRQICDILLAVNRPNFNKSDYIPCILWGRNAKYIQNQKVGTKVTLSGRIQSRSYKKEIESGVYEERMAYEVSCQKIEVLEKTVQSNEDFA